MELNIQDRKKSLTAEELRRRYNLDRIDKDRKAIELNEQEVKNVGATLERFVEVTTENIQELQDQVDGNITTWFLNGVPTLLNEPAVEWTTDTDKDKHLGDLYYDQNTGYAYRFQKSNNVYSWLKLTDSDVTEALAIANSAKDTADSKRRVFVVQPTPPYDIGDIWLRDGELYRCQTATIEGGTYNPAHWILGVDYTDDTVALETQQALNQYKIEVGANYVSNATLETTKNSINANVESIYTYTTTVESKLNDVTTTTNTAIGNNHLYITDAMNSNSISYTIDGATEQDGTPTPTDPVTVETIPSSDLVVKVTGKNIYDMTYNASDVTQAYKYITGGNFSIIQGEKYTISFNTNNNGGIVYANENIFNFQQTTCDGTRKTLTVTASATGTYSGLVLLKSKTAVSTAYSLSNIQVEQGETATAYDNFKSNEVTIDLDGYELCKIGNYKDTLSIDNSGNCTINKNIKKIVLDGSESWDQWATEISGKSRYRINTPDIIDPPSYTSPSNMYCSHYPVISGQSNYSGTTQGICSQNGKSVIIFDNTYCTSGVNSFKTWLSTHNVTVYYVLATPQTITLDNVRIPLFEGINHVTLLDDLETNTSITYYRKTALSGTYATVMQLNDVDVAKSQEIQTVRHDVMLDLNSERLRINALSETIDETGVPILNTNTGYTFDLDGLKIEKSANDVKTVVNNEGIITSYKGTEMLKANKDGVETENITVRKFHIQKPIRMEKTRAASDATKVGLGLYYIGE